jgi:glycolate oxidase FAD binding subunit
VDLIHPHSTRDVQEELRKASAEGTRVLLVGARRQMDRGNPSDIDAELWTTLLDQVVAYDPAEMLVVAEAGVRLGALRKHLGEGGQEWPVDAPDDATVGGVIADGADPVRRLRVGLLRDMVVEMECVTGDGRRVKSGARTVKNVTGFDVHRLVTGSLGTLACITQVALKVRPLPKLRRTLVTLDGGLELGRRLLDTVPLPAAVLAEPHQVVLRLEGFAEEVEEQTVAARTVVGAESRDGATFPEPLFPEAPIVVEATVRPSRLNELLAPEAEWRASIGIGTAWLPRESESQLEELRDRTHALGGIAPVIRGPGGLGDAPIPALDVQRRVKAALDPAGILAPGRFWNGIG